MNLSKLFMKTVISAAVLGAAVTVPWAYCDSNLETYALFQCSERAYIAPVPAPYLPTDAQGLFWQLGFGNDTLNTGQDLSGTGVVSKSNFQGNDNGLFNVDFLDADLIFPTIGFPAGSICLGSNNWANAGVDGCCDNPRPLAGVNYANAYAGFGTPYLYTAAQFDDNYLNPYFGTYFQAIGYPGYYSLVAQQDYPTAMLATVGPPGSSPWFALAAVATFDRNNTDAAENGPCAGYAGSNPAACDIRQGFYDFGGITNGLNNDVTGRPNVVPWQSVPRPQAACTANCSGSGVKDLHIEIPPVRYYHDGRTMPTNNPAMATRNAAQPRDATRAAGVGVPDLLARWGGLVSYSVQQAAFVDDGLGGIDYAALVWSDVPGFTNMAGNVNPNGEPAGPLSFDLLGFPSDTCLRTAVHIGKVPEETALTNSTNCRLGKCGDVGYTLSASDPQNVVCIGGALVSEKIASSALDNSRGVFTVRWTTTSELSVQGFDIYAVSKRRELKVESVTCSECTNGNPGSYSVTISRGNLRGGSVESFRIQMRGGNADSVDLPVHQGGGRSLGSR